jgi:hypothetical protein
MNHLYTEGTQRIPQEVLTLSRAVDECKPLHSGAGRSGVHARRQGRQGRAVEVDRPCVRPMVARGVILLCARCRRVIAAMASAASEA